MENDKNIENDEIQKRYINGKRTTYKATEAAERIGIPASTLRNMTIKLEKLIDPIKKTQGGHRIYSEHNIAQLKEIRRIMEENHYTLEHMIEYLSEPDAIKTIVPGEIEDNIYMNVIARVVESKMDDYFNENMEKLSKHIGGSTEQLNAQLKKLERRITEMSEEQREAIKVFEDKITKERNEAYEELKAKDEELKAREIEIENLKLQLEEKHRRKFSFFGIRRRGDE